MMTRVVQALAIAFAIALASNVAAAQERADFGADTVQRHGPFAAFSASALSLRDSLVSLARAQIGRRYVLGGETPERGFDCSGLVKYLVAAFDMKVPRTAAQQAAVGTAVPQDTSSLRPGDLLLFGSPKRISHIGIYVGEGRFVHASSAAGKVVESKLIRPPTRRIKPWRGVRRVLGDSIPVAATAAPPDDA